MAKNFLINREPIDWSPDEPRVKTEGVYLGKGSSALEVAVVSISSRPTKQLLTRVWKDRRGGRVNPVLVVALYGDQVDICGPSGEDPGVYRGIEPGQARRICEAALNRPDRHAAHRFLRSVLGQLDDELIGVRNQGLLSTHELKSGVPDRGDWNSAVRKSRGLLDKQGRELIQGLGYNLEPLPGGGYVLKDEGRESAVAVFLEEEEPFDQAQERFTGQSPVSYALNKADEKRLENVIVTGGSSVRLYTTDSDAGFGSRGRTDTFVEANTDLLSEQDAGYLWLIFSAEALRLDGSLQEIMERSRDYAADLGKRLRERIYDDVVPSLAKAIANARSLKSPLKTELDRTYEMALVLLYRLLFIAYAEDEGFLPRHNPRYDRRSLKQKAHELHELLQEGGTFDSKSATHWNDVKELAISIHDGHTEWSLPEYNGTLLSYDPEVSPAGGELAEIQLTDEEFGPVLANLLIDETGDGYQGPVDFRNIGVREFGVIYEGLLESELSVADQHLGLDKNDRYVPVEDPENAAIQEGEVYLHGMSGERKATGTYYTKTIFVEHLLQHSLEPALDNHLDSLNQMSDREAEEAFFDLSVADIAMGSGHFLVSAIDHVEARLTSYLAERPLPGVEEELDRLQEAAKDAFKGEEEVPEIERSQLLRRQIARRCIYGVDINPLATQLARLSLWVHTFVPGLPLTFLDYNLVTGDSLAGIGTLNEIADILDVEQTSLGMFVGGKSVINEVREDIAKLGHYADTSAEQVAEARETREEIEKRLEQVRARFDILAASRIDDDIDKSPVSDTSIDDITSIQSFERAQEVLESTSPLHFPAAFPEVFMRDNSGFDVIVGNPPWEEATLEEDEFWMRYVPGLQGMTQIEQERVKEEIREERPDLVEEYEEELEEQEKIRESLRNGPFPGMGTGDPDLYKAFYWRFWSLVRSEGDVGVVLPRSVFVTAGSEEFRRTLLNEGRVNDLTFLINNNEWIFSSVHQQYTIALLGFEKTGPSGDTALPLRGPYPSLESYQEGVEREPARFDLETARNWTGKASFPLLPPNPEAVSVFRRMGQYESLDYDQEGEWRARPCRELDATLDKKKDDGTRLMHFIEDPSEDYWPIFKGASFAPPAEERWINDTGVRYAWGDPEVLVDFLYERRKRKGEHWASPFNEMPKDWLQDKETLPCLNTRLAFRDVTNRTNQRTICAALVPPNVFLTNTAPYFLWPRGDKKDEAYLLGILASIPLDWYARRFVEIHVNFHIINAFPIPRPGRDDPLRQRVVDLSGRLAAKDERYSDWAETVGAEHGPLEEQEELDKIYELDAVVAHLYGLTRDQVKVIFETFHRGWDYEPRLNAVLRYFDEWSDKLGNKEQNV